jgi:rubrerythrin
MTTVVTHDNGGRAQPVGALYVLPDRAVTDAGAPTALATEPIDAAFVADLLSACLAHERCGVHLYRSVARRTTDGMLREQYAHFGDETLEHVSKLEALIAGSGGDPQYVSAAARAAEKAAAALLESTFLIAGSVDPATAELAMLEAVMLAEAKDRANWVVLAELGARLTDDALRAQFEALTSAVLAQEDEHYMWAADARATLVMSFALGTPAPTATTSPDDRTRDELYATAQEMDIPGRSAMTKQQLAAAVAAEGARR